MKKIILFFLVLISSTSIAQIAVNGSPVSSINNSNVFLDASSSFSSEAGAGANIGKGIIIPSLDLVNFAFDLSLADGFTFPTYFDGMVVYNNATGSTLTTGDRSSTSIPVTPGFYYFSNPSGAANANVTGGVWKSLGLGAGSSIKDITATEVVLDKKIDGVQLYAIKGSFTADGVNAAVTINKPTGMTGYYSLTTYKDGQTFRNQIKSFDTVATTANVVMGYGFISEVYPAGTYNYVLEYFK